MSDTTSLWWTEERVKATLCTDYVVRHLQPDNQRRLFDLPPWGEGLTSETYLDWILTRAGRLFLILDDIGIPDRIFALVDESFDDADLPIAAHSVDRLQLSPDGESLALDAKFFHAQWRFLVRGIQEGEHVKYTQNEGVPVELQRNGITNLNRDGVEKVVLAGAVCRVLLRTQVKIGGAPHFLEEEEVLEEVRSLRRLAHEHVFSIYGSYFVDDSISILFTGTCERNLMSFLTDVPQHFKRLDKPRRRGILVNWPHCLANGLSWLHAHGQTHGAVRPSNILIDADYNIFLGQFEALDTLLPPVKVPDVEAYQYGAPERWVRSAIVQETAPTRTVLPSGGRTGRKTSSSGGPIIKLSLSRNKEDQQSDPSSSSSRRESVASQGTAIRIGFPSSPSRFSFALSSSSSGSSNGSGRKRGISSVKRPIFYTPSVTSSNSSGSSGSHPVSGAANPVGLPSSNHHNTVVHTWQSHQTNPPASDIFSLAAVNLDIFTHLCKRKLSTFIQHRGAKNRTAGRGGGVADASFHLDRNVSQVNSWITLLDNDARKRKDPVFRAVKPMLAVVRVMLQKEPANRPSAMDVERSFYNAIRQLDGVIDMHCLSKLHQVRPNGAKASKQEQKQESKPVPPRLTVPGPVASESGTSISSPSIKTEYSAYEKDMPGSLKGYSPPVSEVDLDFGFTEWADAYSHSDDSDGEHDDRVASTHLSWIDPDSLPNTDSAFNFRISAPNR